MAVSAELSPPGKDIFNKQVKSVNRIQRRADGKDVNLYFMRRGRPVYDEQFLFPLRRRQVQLANVEMIGGRAEVWLVNGRIFSIEFSKPPKTMVEQGTKIEKVMILRDPMIAALADADSDANRREEVLATIRSKLPEDYLQLVGEGQGTMINHWAVRGVQDIHKIPQRDGNYYLLAEKENMGAVGVKEDEMTGQLYYLDYGDDRGEKISIGLKPFLERFDGGKVMGRF